MVLSGQIKNEFYGLDNRKANDSAKAKCTKHEAISGNDDKG
jgi:hypothetical protein